ncbi:hypothetical protein AB0876_31865 [Mycobacterium sp. NPDC049093]
MSSRRAEVQLPLECGGCGRSWPERCRCTHPQKCRACGQPLKKPYAATAGYCTLDCFHHSHARDD